MPAVYIVSAARTPIGNFNGSLSKVSASDLGGTVIQEVIKRANVSPEDINEVVMGQSLTAGEGQNTGRQAAWKGGVPKETPAYVINMLCGSGLKSIILGYQSIMTGDSSIIVCGGQENMSKAPHVIHLRDGIKIGSTSIVDTLLKDGLNDAFYNIHMGITAENISKKFDITRTQQDEFAKRSQELAATAQRLGYFTEEIVPVTVPSRNGSIIFDKDEYIKADTTMEGLTKLKPCFDKNGTVTAGNASGLNDSAAAVLLMSENEVVNRNIKPMARIVGYTQCGYDPNIMGMALVPTVENLLKKCNWTKEEVDLYELNEAFAAVSCGVNKELGVNPDKVNIYGGAIALGHPIGASGCRILVTLIYALKRTGGKKGIAALCIGGGMGIAMAIEII